MITDSLLNVVFGIVNFILSPVSLVEWGFDLFYLSPLHDILRIIYFVIPIDKIFPIIVFIISMFIFRAIIALIKTIWDILPIV